MHPDQADFTQAQVEYLYATLIRDVVISLLAATTVFFLLYLVADRSQLWAWYAGMAAVAVFRLALLFGYRHQPRPGTTEKYWSMAYTFSMVLLGVAWSYTLIIALPPVPLDYAFAIQTILTGIGVMSIYQLFYHPFACSALLLPIFLSWTALQFYRGTPPSIAIGLAAVGFFITLIIVAVKGENYTKEKLELKAEVERKKTEAEEANVAKSKFLAAASHDLRQPLYSSTLFASLIRQQNKDPRLTPVIQNLTQSLESLERLLDALLDMSKLDSGNLTPVFAHLRIRTLFDALEREFGPLARKKHLAFAVTSDDAVVHTDPVLLELMLRNLLSNAIRYTDEGTVCLAGSSSAEGVGIAVKDTGLGIPLDDQQRIFNEFIQLHNPERNRRKGLGLGLSIVRRITQILGIPLELNSEVGKGSEFRITLPEGNPDLVLASSNQPISNGADIASLQVWVFEDDTDVRHALHALLENWGCHVQSFAGQTDLRRYLENLPPHPDAILADFMLEGNFTGEDAIDMVRESFRRQVAAVIITGDTKPERIAALKALGHQVLRKPAKPAQLRTFLGAVKRDKVREDTPQ